MGDNNESQSGAPAGRRDGTIDFARYDTGQLIELRDSLDRAAFPLNFAALIAELDKRSTQIEQPQGAGRLTSRDGLLGWLQGKWKRQPLYGEATCTVDDKAVHLQGWQRTWLGMPIERVLSWPLDRIRNVASSKSLLRFEVRRSGWFARRVELALPTAAQATELAAKLPQERTARFDRQGVPLLAFEEQLRVRCPVAWLTPVLVLLNLIVFAAAWIAVGQLAGLPQSPVTFWFANVGPLTLGGQWWRLVTALFIHGSLAHVLLNMWALWHIGRLTERLFGRWTFLSLYLASGILAGLTSLAWDPARLTVGASGAIFGLFGAFVAALIHPGSGIPRGALRAHLLPTLLFMAYNIATSALQPGIDNAAHVGGAISGFLLGFLLSGPAVAPVAAAWVRRTSLPLVLFFALLGTAVWYLQSARGTVPVTQEFARKQQWYVTGETRNFATWNQLAVLAGGGSISDEQLASRFEKEVLPFWESALPRLQGQYAQTAGEERKYLVAVIEYVRLRRDWSQALVKAVKNRDAEQLRLVTAKAESEAAVLAPVQLVAVRSSAAQLAGGLVNSPAVQNLSRLVSGKEPTCVQQPAAFGIAVSPEDSREDAPAMADAIACAAQRDFLRGDFRRLDAQLTRQSAHLADLPSGASSLNATTAGLRDLFTYGSDGMEKNLRSIASWRRSVPNSDYPDLAEAMVFNEWAWSARGHGTANQITQQAWAQFAFRNEMAWAALQGATQPARLSPFGCQMTLLLQHDRSVGADKMRATLDECIGKYPRDYALYRVVLRSLMPRWSGSAEKVSEFINEVAASGREPGPVDLYVLLYWIYADLERDEVNIFTDTFADWGRIKFGFGNLMGKYPKSDLILNSYARFACLAGDADAYRRVRPEVQKRLSATGWTAKTSLSDCDHKYVT